MLFAYNALKYPYLRPKLVQLGDVIVRKLLYLMHAPKPLNATKKSSFDAII